MIFQNRAKKNSNLEFHIGKETIDIVHEYTYLGTRISSIGNFNISLKHLKEKALHALFSLRKHTDFNSEIWGVFVKHDFKAWDNIPIEKKKPLEIALQLECLGLLWLTQKLSKLRKTTQLALVACFPFHV